ncbi:MAG: DUF2807 domain-containing protein [Bacteroidales bacterium]|nr:DUF2807 domain-containing protein [Bacteroidales bacterium]
MKKNLIVLSIIAMTAFCSCSEWAGDPITQKFNIDGTYTELVVGDAFDVIFSDTATSITVTAGENVMPKVKVNRNGNKLNIFLKGWATNRGKEMTVILPYNSDLCSVDLAGASSFHTDFPLKAKTIEIELSGASDFYGDIEAEQIEMDLSGSSDFNGNIVADELELDMSGASDATLVGQVSTLKIELSGASTIKKTVAGSNYALSCTLCEGDLSGSSTAYIHSDGSIIVSLSGASELHYTGNAVTRGSNTSGGSNLVHDVL